MQANYLFPVWLISSIIECWMLGSLKRFSGIHSIFWGYNCILFSYTVFSNTQISAHSFFHTLTFLHTLFSGFLFSNFLISIPSFFGHSHFGLSNFAHWIFQLPYRTHTLTFSGILASLDDKMCGNGDIYIQTYKSFKHIDI